jgi:putative membrane protein
MPHFLIRLLAVVFALFLAAYVVPGITVDSIYAAAVVAVVLGVLNVLVRPILVVLTLPVTIITLGLFLLVLNAALFWFVGSIIDGFEVVGFVPALLGSIIVSAISSLAQKIAA